ncbi:hypothetical protein ACS0TY_032581 [Phlomoides rotata]
MWSKVKNPRSSWEAVLKENPSVVDENDTDTARCVAHDQLGQRDFLCRNYILRGQVDALYNVYCSVRVVKDLWNSLEHKYLIEDTGMKYSLRPGESFTLSFLERPIINFTPQKRKAKTNLMKRGEPSKKTKRNDDKDKKYMSEKPKFNGDCYNSGKPNHRARNCKVKKEEDKNKTVVYEENLVNNHKEWFLDTSATCHICSTKMHFQLMCPLMGESCT